MGRVLQKCFRTLKGEKPCPLNDAARWFCSSLSEDLEKLEQSLVDNSVSLRWSAQAMHVLKKMQVDFLYLVEKSEVPFSLEGEDWLDQYMRETVILLDFCNLLKSAISGFERYQIVVDFVTKKIVDGSLIAKNHIEMQRLESESKKLNGMDNWDDVRFYTAVPEFTKCKKGINPVIFAVKSTMIIISLLVVSAIISPVSIDIEGEIGLEIPQLRAFSSSIRTLICRFRERIRGLDKKSSLVLVEHEMVERALADVKAHLAEGVVDDGERLFRSVDLLKTRSIDLKESLEMFDTAVNDVFEEVIKGRNKLLEMYSAGTVA